MLNGWIRVAMLLGPCVMVSALAAQQSQPDNPVLKERPPVRKPGAASVIAAAGRIQLDVVAAGASGKPVAGLGPWDFKVLDNGQPEKILTFREFDGVRVKPDPAVEVILVIDTLNLTFQQVAFVRDQVEEFLRADGGHLNQPTALVLLSDAGIRVQPRATMDGNAEAAVVHQIKGGVSSISSAMGSEGALERFQLSVRQLEAIADNEAKAPGRKLLIWVGPGWPMLTRQELSSFSNKDQLRYFDAIVALSTGLRKSRMAVYSVSPQDSSNGAGMRDTAYMGYLKGVKSASQADSANLALKVLAVQSGGEVLGPDNDVAGQIARCVADANAFYRISFNPAVADQATTYHELRVILDRPGVTARTNSGYYMRP
ncbi:MAG TPA: VWA domain-containing protein [Terracidiphilus sp.]|nr:VWA domain-containing protein [Terracidiphilus sp.]